MNPGEHLSSPSPPLHRHAVTKPVLWLGIIIGFTPILAGLIFRTYGFHVAPRWAEVLRQLDLPFILVEIAVIIWARQAGLKYRAVFARLDRPAQGALLLFLASFWVSSAVISADPSYSLLRASFWLVHIGFGFAVFHLAGSLTGRDLQGFGAALCAGFVVMLPLTAFHLLNAPIPNSLPEGKIIWSSAIPGALSVRHLGIWSALIFACAAAGLSASKPKSREEAIAAAVVFLATATLFWSGTRSGLYGICGALVVMFVTLRRVPRRRTVLLVGIASLAGICISELWIPQDGAFGILKRDSLLAEAGGDMGHFSSGRTVLWSAMVQAFAHSPIFGVGEGAVQWLASIGGERHVQPHNSIIQMISSWGIVASLAAGYLLVRLRWMLHRMAQNDAVIVGIVLMIDCLLIMSLADGVLYFSRFIMWFSALAALALAVAQRGVVRVQAGPTPSGAGVPV